MGLKVIYSKVPSSVQFFNNWTTKVLHLMGLWALFQVTLHERSQCPIYNCTLETLIWSIMWKIKSFFLTRNLLIPIISPLLIISKKCLCHFYTESANKNKQLKKKNTNILSILDQTKLLKIQYKSGIAFLAWRVTWN